MLKVPSMGLAPCRLYSPNGESFLTDMSTGLKTPFVVISYTWGRWMLKTRERDTPIKGAKWCAPANSLFTRTELDFAIRKIAQDSNAWVDVFCIPQNDDDPQKAIEIGKQGSIFRMASHAAVWLGTGGEDVLEEVCSWVPETVEMIPVSIFTLPNDSLLNFKGRPENRNEETWRRMKIISEFTKRVPWASSLWTLQESALRPDAVFYSKLGEPLLHRDSKRPITIRQLRTSMRTALFELLEFVKTLHTSTFGSTERPDLWGPSNKDSWSVSEDDISEVFRAIDTANEVSLHNLGTMNAGELLIASKQRTASAAQDRVYGIMGAIGVNVNVNYQMEPTRVFNNFLLELHNQVPIEVQAFHRTRLFRPKKRQWLMDEDAKLLTLLRQKEPPEHMFIDIDFHDYLVVNKIEYLGAAGLAYITGLIISNRMLVAADRPAFRQFTEGSPGKDSDGGSDIVLAHLCHALRQVASKTRLGLIYLGTVGGIDHLGWRTAYMLLGQHLDCLEDSKTNTRPDFQRMGLVIGRERFSFTEPVKGTFTIG